MSPRYGAAVSDSGLVRAPAARGGLMSRPMHALGRPPAVVVIDAATLSHGRTDRRFFLVEGTTSSNIIYPIALHYCFSENQPNYEDFFDFIKTSGYPAVIERLDDLQSKINGDRHSGLAAAS